MRISCLDLGLVDFKKAELLQKEAFLRVRSGEYAAVLLACEHNPVITLGRSAMTESVLLPEQELKEKGILICSTCRGGDATYHGPGQLTVYPVIDLGLFKKDIHAYLRGLERVIIGFLEKYGVKARQNPGLTGVWIQDKKIASIGIAIKNWISFHGLSINISNQSLPGFSFIKPCGMDIQVTSLEENTCRQLRMEKVKQDFLSEFKKAFFN